MNQCEYLDAVVFSSASDKDIELARKLATLIEKEIKITGSGGTSDGIKIGAFYDSFNELSYVLDRINTAVQNSSMYFVILTEKFVSDRLDSVYIVNHFVWETIKDKDKVHSLIPVYSKNLKNNRKFFKRVSHFEMLTPLYFEDIISDNQFERIDYDDLDKVTMNKYTKIKLTKKFSNKLDVRLVKIAEIMQAKIEEAELEMAAPEIEARNDDSIYTINEISMDDIRINSPISSLDGNQPTNKDNLEFRGPLVRDTNSIPPLESYSIHETGPIGNNDNNDDCNNSVPIPDNANLNPTVTRAAHNKDNNNNNYNDDSNNNNNNNNNNNSSNSNDISNNNKDIGDNHHNGYEDITSPGFNNNKNNNNNKHNNTKIGISDHINNYIKNDNTNDKNSKKWDICKNTQGPPPIFGDVVQPKDAPAEDLNAIETQVKEFNINLKS